MSNLCGFFCLAFIYFLTVSKYRTKNIINDASIFLDLFEDLDITNDIYKNEFILSLFFTDKKSKKLLFDNNNIGMNKDNKIDTDLRLKISRYYYKSFSSVLIGLLLLDDKDEPSSTFNNLGSITNRFFFIHLV